MRAAFVRSLCEAAAEDPRTFLLTGDLGWSVLEPFAERFPDRFVNAGVAEANLIGVATGLARAGYTPWCYTIATFASMRGYEMLRNGPVLHGLPVRVAGVGGGFAYGHAGPTHFALEDLAIGRVQPGLTVVAPADPRQTATVMAALADHDRPAYVRVGKGGNPEVPGLDGRFAFGRPEVVVPGADLLILATGAIAANAVEAAARARSAGTIRTPAVAVLAHLPAAPTDALVALLARYRRVLTVEEGYTAGGLGSLAAEAIAAGGLGAKLAVRGVGLQVRGGAGTPAFLQRAHGLDPASLAEAAAALLAG